MVRRLYPGSGDGGGAVREAHSKNDPYFDECRSCKHARFAHGPECLIEFSPPGHVCDCHSHECLVACKCVVFVEPRCPTCNGLGSVRTGCTGYLFLFECPDCKGDPAVGGGR